MSYVIERHALTFPVRIEWIFLEVVSHMPAPDCPSLATHVCCRMFAQPCTHTDALSPVLRYSSLGS